MKILIMGCTGMLGHRLMLDLGKKHQVWGTLRKTTHTNFNLPAISADRFLDLKDCLNEAELDRCFQQVAPDMVINCIGVIKQAPQGKEYIPSISINSLFPHVLTKICERHNSRLILLSTDCVFDGVKGNYSEQDLPNSVDLYGHSKLMGEVGYSPNVLTLRTSIIGRELNSKGSLVEWFLSKHKQTINGYSGAIYTGFPTHTLANIIDQFILPQRELAGVYHLSSEAISKYELLKMVNEIFDNQSTIVEDKKFHMDRSLDSQLFRQKTGFKPKPWAQMVQDLLVDQAWYAAQNKVGSRCR